MFGASNLICGGAYLTAFWDALLLQPRRLGENMFQDLRWYGVRMLTKNPGSTAVAVLSFALGIMATTAIYSVIYAVVLDPFPYKDVDHLMSVKVGDPNQRGYRTNYSTDQFLEIAERSTIFEGVIASTISDVLWTDKRNLSQQPEGKSMDSVWHRRAAASDRLCQCFEPAAGKGWRTSEGSATFLDIALLLTMVGLIAC